jgi:hypothetical protein
MPAAIAGQEAGAGQSKAPSDGPDAGDGTGGSPEQVTVNVTGRACRALDLATELTDDTKTDTVNRALQVYAYLEQVTARGGTIYVRKAAGTRSEEPDTL